MVAGQAARFREALPRAEHDVRTGRLNEFLRETCVSVAESAMRSGHFAVLAGIYVNARLR
jgi:hypothetical protein